MSSDQLLRDREDADQKRRIDGERFKFVKDLETHLGDIVSDVVKIRIALEKWKQNAQRHTIDGEGIEMHLCDVSNTLDSICTELSGL